MARIRSIKPEFFRHEGLFELELETGLPMRVAFAGLWTAADREGRFKWKPRELKLDCLPHDQLDFSRVLDALTSRGFVVKYEVAGVFYGCIPSWQDHQVVNNREAASVLPSAPETPSESTTSTRDERVSGASTTPLVQEQGEGKGREGKGKEGEGKGELPPQRVGDASAAAPAETKKGTRLPEEFQLPKAWGEWALGKYPHWTPDTVRAIASKFRNYWVAKTGRDATKLDWKATWENWCDSGITQDEHPAPKAIGAGAIAAQAQAAESRAKGERLKAALLAAGGAVQPASNLQTVDMPE